MEEYTNVNTGRKNGIVIQLQKLFLQKKLEELQFISFGYHILDPVLRVVTDGELGGKHNIAQ